VAAKAGEATSIQHAGGVRQRHSLRPVDGAIGLVFQEDESMMKKLFYSAALATLFGLVLGASAAQAQPPAKEEAKSDCAPLTPAAIKTILENMGYEPKEMKTTDGQIYGYEFAYKGKSYNYGIQITVSPNKKFVWVGSWLKKLPDPKIPQDVIMALLKENEEGWGLPYLTYSERHNYFRAKFPHFNRGLKPADIRSAIDDLDGFLTATATIWDPEKWPTAKPKTGGEDKKPADR
jgi:hypothetical protein